MRAVRLEHSAARTKLRTFLSHMRAVPACRVRRVRPGEGRLFYDRVDTKLPYLQYASGCRVRRLRPGPRAGARGTSPRGSRVGGWHCDRRRSAMSLLDKDEGLVVEGGLESAGHIREIEFRLSPHVHSL